MWRIGSPNNLVPPCPPHSWVLGGHCPPNYYGGTALVYKASCTRNVHENYFLHSLLHKIKWQKTLLTMQPPPKDRTQTILWIKSIKTTISSLFNSILRSLWKINKYTMKYNRKLTTTNSWPHHVANLSHVLESLSSNRAVLSCIQETFLDENCTRLTDAHASFLYRHCF